MTRPAHWPPAGEPEVHPLPPRAQRDPIWRAEEVSPFAIDCRAATAPPPVRMIRLDSGIHGPRRSTLDSLEAAAEAAAFGRMAISEAYGEGKTAGMLATRAAHFARLALGASS